MQHQDTKCHQGRQLHQFVSLSAKKNKKGQNTEVMKLNSRQLINPQSQDRNNNIEVKMI